MNRSDEIQPGDVLPHESSTSTALSYHMRKAFYHLGCASSTIAGTFPLNYVLGATPFKKLIGNVPNPILIDPSTPAEFGFEEYKGVPVVPVSLVRRCKRKDDYPSLDPTYKHWWLARFHCPWCYQDHECFWHCDWSGDHRQYQGEGCIPPCRHNLQSPILHGRHFIELNAKSRAVWDRIKENEGANA